MKLVLKIDGKTYDMYSAALHNAIKHIQAELETAKAENEDLCDNIDAARQDLSDYLDGTLEGKLRDENKRLRGENYNWKHYLLPKIEPLLNDAKILIIDLIKKNGGADASSYDDVVFSRKLVDMLDELKALKTDKE